MSQKIQITPIEKWGLNLHRPLWISGPCSAESEEQVRSTCRSLAEEPVHVLRAGIWKPRTRPNTFEGIGSVGLKWLKDTGFDLNIPVTVEVANVKHVYEALRTGVDILWIGARTTVNPFAVQEICDALSGVDIPVMIKNPINPDLELWIGAFERFNQAGITKLAAIHRGFSTYEKTRYRNIPKWEIPIELKRRCPDMPVICDPSHICGNREMLQEISQTAMDLDFDGLMIESHINPDKALSDARQQVTPAEFGRIIDSLILRQSINEHPESLSELETMRSSIDRIDKYILELMAERMEIARSIGVYKKQHNLTILQTSRWDEVVSSRIEIGVRKKLSAKFLENVFQGIHKESIYHQTRIMNDPSVGMEEANKKAVNTEKKKGEA